MNTSYLQQRPNVTQNFRYLKRRNPNLYKPYGYSLCKGKPNPQNSLIVRSVLNPPFQVPEIISDEVEHLLISPKERRARRSGLPDCKTQGGVGWNGLLVARQQGRFFKGQGRLLLLKHFRSQKIDRNLRGKSQFFPTKSKISFLYCWKKTLGSEKENKQQIKVKKQLSWTDVTLGFR